MDLDARRKALISEIKSAFKGVTREGAVPWGKTIEDAVEYSKDKPWTRTEELELVEFLDDKDKSWEDLVDNPKFKLDGFYGGFDKLDPTGWRYYLPAAMLKCLNASAVAKESYSLDLGEKFFGEALAVTCWSHVLTASAKKERIARLALLNSAQLTSVKHFVEFKRAETDARFKQYLKQYRFDPRSSMAKQQRLLSVGHWEDAYLYWKKIPG